jgi:protein-disulfide isomerase
VFRHLAPDAKAPAVLAHRAALAAAAQSRFWEMAQLLFANPDRHAREDVIGMARQLRLDLARFIADLDAPDAETVLAADYARARERGFNAAPAYIVNGKVLSGIRTLDELEALAVR